MFVCVIQAPPACSSSHRPSWHETHCRHHIYRRHDRQPHIRKGRHHPAPPSSAQLRPAPPSSAQLRPAPPNSAQFRSAPPSSAQLRPTPPSSAQLRPVPPSSAQLRPASPNAAQLRPTPPSSAQLHPTPPSSTNTFSFSRTETRHGGTKCHSCSVFKSHPTGPPVDVTVCNIGAAIVWHELMAQLDGTFVKKTNAS